MPSRSKASSTGDKRHGKSFYSNPSATGIGHIPNSTTSARQKELATLAIRAAAACQLQQQTSREAEIVQALKDPEFAKEIAQILKDRKEPVTDAEEFIRHAIRQVQSPELEAHEKLILCTPGSVQTAVKKLAVMGLSPNADQAEGWLVPRWSKKVGSKVATAVPGVRGMERKLMETGKVANIESRAIYLQDFCKVKLGTENHIDHEVNFCPDPEKPNPIIGSYGIVTLKDGRREIAIKRLYQAVSPHNGQDAKEGNQQDADQERSAYMDEETRTRYLAQRPAMKGALNKFFKEDKALQALVELEEQSYESAINPDAKQNVTLKVDSLQNALTIPRAQVPVASSTTTTSSAALTDPPQQVAAEGADPSNQNPVDQILEGVRQQYGEAETKQTVRR
jgi:recombinational DNA repair protein RecT